MPVISVADAAGELLVVRYFGSLTAEAILASNAESAGMVTRSGPFATLLIFESSVDLSTIDAAAVKTIRQTRKQQFLDYGLQRRAGAAVVEAAQDANLLLPLWNALSDTDPEVDLRVKLFHDFGPALAWLGIDAALAMPLVARTGHAPRG
jgi:hypothetical protein